MIGTKLSLGALVTLSAFAIALGGCAGKVADEHQITEVDSSGAALTSPAPADPAGGGSTTGEGEDGEADDDGQQGGHGDHECDGEERGHGKHHGHRRHKFKALDALDGNDDGAITIASLPADLPERLLAKLHSIDADGDGVVTKVEAKAALRGKKHRRKGH
jgi:hypothetical protein